MGSRKKTNIIITGVGGQGVITLLRILAETALIEGKEVRSSELHGLSQKGGNVTAHLRMGRNIFSPLVRKGDADLVIGLEMSEALRAVPFSYQRTRFLVNKKFLSYAGGPTQEHVLDEIQDLPFEKEMVEASRICREELGKEIVAGVYLVSHAVCTGTLPLKKTSLSKALEMVLPPQYLELNKKAFELACDEQGS